MVDEFILGWGGFAESALPSLAVVGAFDPDDNLDAEVVAGLQGVNCLGFRAVGGVFHIRLG